MAHNEELLGYLIAPKGALFDIYATLKIRYLNGEEFLTREHYEGFKSWEEAEDFIVWGL